MGEIKVAIYERVKLDGKWTRVRAEIPSGRKRDGRLFLKDDRQGKFQLSCYEERRKKCRTSRTQLTKNSCLVFFHALKAPAAARRKLADELP